MRIVPRFIKPTQWLKCLSYKPDEYNSDYTKGQIYSLRWQRWWMKHMPHRTYPVLPFKKVVYWNWRKYKIVLPRPWAKDNFKI